MSFLLNPFVVSSALDDVPARYWRINITALGSGTTANLAELQLYESQFGPNVAIGGTASADSFNTVGGPNWVSSLAFDSGIQDQGTFDTGNTSAWISDSGALPHWLAYDLGSGNDKSIVAIGLHGRRKGSHLGNPTAFDVQRSDDGSSWSTVWSESGLSWVGFDYKRLVNPAYTEPGYTGSPHGSHSHWRIVAQVSQAGSGGDGDSAAVAITELEFRATLGGGDQATGGSIAASSIYSGSFPASQAVDNNGSTFWHNGSGLTWGWLRYDFAAPVEVAEIAITARNTGSPVAGPRHITVQWADSSSGPWTTAWNIANQSGWSLSEQRVFTDPEYI